MPVEQSRLVLLYVEDELLVQDVVELALREAGFEVMVAATGAEAMDALEAGSESFRAIITGVNLGDGPDGWDVARRGRELNQATPVVYMTGGSAHEWASKGVPRSILIEKPFAPAQLVVAISSLLMKTDT
jgi:DNA-binding response OmpR family regulator